MATGFLQSLNNQYLAAPPNGITGSAYTSTGPQAPTGGNWVVWSVLANSILYTGTTGTTIKGNLAISGNMNTIIASATVASAQSIIVGPTGMSNVPSLGILGSATDKLVFVTGTASTYPVTIGNTGSVLYQSAASLNTFIGGTGMSTINANASTRIGMGSVLTQLQGSFLVGSNSMENASNSFAIGTSAGMSTVTGSTGSISIGAYAAGFIATTGYTGGEGTNAIAIGINAGYQSDVLFSLQNSPQTALPTSAFLAASASSTASTSTILLPQYNTTTYYVSTSSGQIFTATVTGLANVFTTVYSNTTGTTYFALSTTIPFYSTNSGGNWQQVSGAPSALACSAGVSLSLGTILYATGSFAGVAGQTTNVIGSVYVAQTTTSWTFTQLTTTTNTLPANTGYYGACAVSGTGAIGLLSYTVLNTSSTLYFSSNVNAATPTFTTFSVVLGTSVWTSTAINATGNTMVAGTSGGHVYVGSSSILTTTTPLTLSFQTGAPVTSVAISPTGQLMAVVTASAVFVSYNAGISFSTVANASASAFLAATLTPTQLLITQTGSVPFVYYTLVSSVATVAIGANSGNINQGANTLAIGVTSGATAQGVNAIAIGVSSGNTNQSANAVSIGYQTSMENDTISYGIPTNYATTLIGAIGLTTYVPGISANGQTIIVPSLNTYYLSSNGGTSFASAVTISIVTTAGFILVGNFQGTPLYLVLSGSTSSYSPICYGVGSSSTISFTALGSVFPIGSISAAANSTFNHIIVCGTNTSGTNVYGAYNASPVSSPNPYLSPFTTSNGSIFGFTTYLYGQSAMSSTYTPLGGIAVLTPYLLNTSSVLYYSSNAHLSLGSYPSGVVFSTIGGLPTLPSTSYWNAVAISATGTFILAGIYGGGVYLSSNGNAGAASISFSLVSPSTITFPMLGFWTWASMSSSGQVMVLANLSNTIYVSYTYGITWTLLASLGSRPVLSADASKLIILNATIGTLYTYTATNTILGYAGVAVGGNAGMLNQAATSVAVGYNAGKLFQGATAVAIGAGAGLTAQSVGAIAIGATAGTILQGTGAIAIGQSAGIAQQGSAVAIGQGVGTTQGVNAIAIGAGAARGPTGSVPPTTWNGITGFVSTVGWTGYTGTQNPGGIAIGTNAALANDFPQVYTQLTNISGAILPTGYAGSSISGNGQVILTSVYNSINTYYLSTNGGQTFSGPNAISGATTFSWSAVSANGQYFFILGYNSAGTSCNYYYSGNGGTSWVTTLLGSLYVALPYIATSALFNTIFLHFTNSNGLGSIYWGFTSNPATTTPVFTTLTSGTNGMPGGLFYSQIGLSSGTTTTSGYAVIATINGSTNALSALTSSSLYYSTNAGSATTPTFTLITPSATNNLPTVTFNVWAACAISSTGQYILVSLATGPVYLCVNGGAGSTAATLVFNQIPGLVINCLTGNTLLPDISGGIYQSQLSNASMSDSGQYMVITNVQTIVEVSYNYGISWYTLVLPITFTGSINTHVVMSNDGTRLLIITTLSTSLLYYTLTQKTANTIAIGTNAGTFNQFGNAVAMGINAGATNQGIYSVSIGANAGQTNAPAYSVAIGNAAIAENDTIIYGTLQTYLGNVWLNTTSVSANGQYISGILSAGTAAITYYTSSNSFYSNSAAAGLVGLNTSMTFMSGTGQFQLVYYYNGTGSGYYYSTTSGPIGTGLPWPNFAANTNGVLGIFSSASSYSFQWFLLNCTNTTSSNCIYWGYNANPLSTPALSIFSTIGGSTNSNGLPTIGIFGYIGLSYNTAQYSIIPWIIGTTTNTYTNTVISVTASLLYYSSTTNSTTSASVQYAIIPTTAGIPILPLGIYWAVSIISGNGQYIIAAASNGTVYLSSNGTIGNAANLVFNQVTSIPSNVPYWFGGAISSNGQYISLLTNTATSTNTLFIYVSYNYGATWLTLYSFQSTSAVAGVFKISMSNDGSRLTAAGGGTSSTLPFAIGIWSLQVTTAINSVAIGNQSSFFNAGSNIVSIGYQSGYNSQGNSSIAIGYQAAFTSQNFVASFGSIAIGYQSGILSQGYNAIAIGYQAGSYSATTGQPANTFMISTASVRSSGYGQVSSGALMYATNGELYYRSASKTFVIDHPTTPDAYLVHACLEGPEAGVYVRGEGVILSESVDITLPSYSDALATTYTIHVTGKVDRNDTTIGTKSYRASRVVGGVFTVYGPPGAFFWHAYGKRGDIVTEPMKSDVTKYGDGPYTYIAGSRPQPGKPGAKLCLARATEPTNSLAAALSGAHPLAAV